MQEERYTRGPIDPAPNEPPAEGASVFKGAGPGARLGQVESVPSELLWRAAILAARQAALSAAELRRVLDERTPPTLPPVVPPDGGASQPLS